VSVGLDNAEKGIKKEKKRLKSKQLEGLLKIEFIKPALGSRLL